VTNVPTDPYSEEAWSKIVGNPQGLRSIFTPTEVYSLFVYSGRDLVAIPFERVPFVATVLKDFVIPSLARKSGFSIFLMLEGRLSLSKEIHTVSFPVRWRSRHTRSNGDIVFLYRPSKISVLVPATDESDAVDRLPSATSAGKQLTVPIDQVLRFPASTLARFTRPKVLRNRIPSIPSNGFRGVPSAPYPEETFIEIFDAHFPPTGPAYLDGQRSLQTFYRNKVSVKTPNFRNLSKGQLPVNPFSFTQVRTDDMPSMDRLTFPPSSGLVSTNFYGATAFTFVTPPPLPGHNSSVRSKAIKNVIAKAEEDIAANLAQDFAQFGQINRLIAGNATKIAKSIQAVKRGDVASAINALGVGGRTTSGGINSPARKGRPRGKLPSASDTVADSWLQIQYGWKPLLQDIDGAMRLLANSILKKPRITTVRSGSQKQIKTSSEIVFFPGKEGIIIEESNYFSTRVGVRYTYRSELVNYLQQTGFTNPINLAWEILPYSFVVDWFVPIGPYLETLSAWQSKTFVGGFITDFSRGEVSCGFDLSNESGGFVRNVKGGYRRSSIQVARNPLGDFPRLSLPVPKNPVSTDHALNAIALLQRAFAR
jgi:hypothetical protein